MDQLQKVRNRIAERIAEKKSMPLVEQIRYEHYLDCLYKIAVKTLNGEKITEKEFKGIFNPISLVSGAIQFYNLASGKKDISYAYKYLSEQSPQWPLLGECLENFYYMPYVGYNIRKSEEDSTITHHIYDQFDEVLKHMK